MQVFTRLNLPVRFENGQQTIIVFLQDSSERHLFNLYELFEIFCSDNLGFCAPPPLKKGLLKWLCYRRRLGHGWKIGNPPTFVGVGPETVDPLYIIALLDTILIVDYLQNYANKLQITSK